MLDLVKDVYYCLMFQHNHYLITMGIGVLSIFPMAFTVLAVFLLTKNQYRKIFPSKNLDLLHEKYGKNIISYNLRFQILKI